MDDAERIDLLFKSVLARFFTIPARQPAVGDATFGQVRALWTLDFLGPAGLNQLARTLGVSNPAATELVDRLVERGYVRRAASESDRRCVVLTLRPRGRRILAQFGKHRRARFSKLLRVLDRRDVARLAEALETVRGILSKWREDA